MLVLAELLQLLACSDARYNVLDCFKFGESCFKVGRVAFSLVLRPFPCFGGVSQVTWRKKRFLFQLTNKIVWLASATKFSLLTICIILSARCSQNKFDHCLITPHLLTSVRKEHLIPLLMANRASNLIVPIK